MVDSSPERPHVRSKVGVVVATLWLDVIVVVFIVVMVGRVSTPIAGWIERMSQLLMMKQ